MNNINAKIVAGLLIGVVVFASLMLYAVPSVLTWLVTFPLLFISIIIITISIYVWKSKDDSKYIKIGLFLACSGILFDLFLPPYSSCSFAPAGTEQLAIQQSGTSAFAEDTAICQIFLSTGLNRNLIVTNVNGNLLMYMFPVMLLPVLISIVLATKINKKYWTTAIYSIILMVVVVLSAEGQHYSQAFALTIATIVTYGIFPLILLLIATKLLGDPDNSSGSG